MTGFSEVQICAPTKIIVEVFAPFNAKSFVSDMP
jgi:hypothetical protein